MASSSKITAQLTAHYGQDHIHFIDGFPIPVCRYSRAKDTRISKNMQVLVIVLHNKRNTMVLKGIL